MPTFAFPCDMSDLSTLQLCRIYWRAVAETAHLDLGCETCRFADFHFAIRGQLESEARNSRLEMERRNVDDVDLDEIYRLACCAARGNRFRHDFILPRALERKCNEISRTKRT